MMNDEIVEQVRKARQEQAAKLNLNLNAILAGARTNGTSIGVEKTPKVIGENISASLPENAVASSSVELPMIGNGQCFHFAGLVHASQFDVAAALGKDEKAELLKDRSGFRPRKPL